MTVVCDASVVFAALAQDSPSSAWAREVLRDEMLVAPAHMAMEVASALRRNIRLGQLSETEAVAVYRDLLDLSVVSYAFEPFAARIWQLRANVTPQDAWYVALAESEGVPLATLDRRLTSAPGLRCGFLLPPT